MSKPSGGCSLLLGGEEEVETTEVGVERGRVKVVDERKEEENVAEVGVGSSGDADKEAAEGAGDENRLECTWRSGGWRSARSEESRFEV